MLESLFENIKEYGKYIRQNHLDGLESWNKIKNFVQNSSQQDGLNKINKILQKSEWNIGVKINSTINFNIEEIYNYVHGDTENDLKIFGEEGDEEAKALSHDDWEKNHFFLQLIRIPKNNKINLVRLLQVAYNLGQLSVYLENNDNFYSSKAMEYFKTNKLDEISSYIKLTPEQHEELNNTSSINEFVSDVNTFILEQTEQVGGKNNEKNNEEIYKKKYNKYKNKYVELKKYLAHKKTL